MRGSYGESTAVSLSTAGRWKVHVLSLVRIVWALTSVVCESPDRYADEIMPLTWPLMERYAAKHEMEWRPKIITRAEYGDFAGKGTAPHGTASVYASLPHRRALLDEFEGVVFFDCDNVITPAGMQSDICTAVTDEQPICTEPGCNCAVMVLKSCAKTKEMLDHIWASATPTATTSGWSRPAYMDMMGFDGRYPGDFQPPVWLGATEWTPLRADLPVGWNAHPLPPAARSAALDAPGGIQPFERRMEYVREYARRSQSRDTLETSTTGGENP